MKPRLISLILVSALLAGLIFAIPTPGRSQAEQPEGAIYIVQSGDSLWSIAARFRVSMADLAAANGRSENSTLNVGDRLLIPGLEGIHLLLTTTSLPYGENLHSLSRRLGIEQELLAQLNHLSSPAELYAGVTLILPAEQTTPAASKRRAIAPGQSLLELAATEGTNPWHILEANQLPGAAHVLPGDVLQLPVDDPAVQPGEPGPGALPGSIQEVQFSPDPLIQGQTASLVIHAIDGLALSGMLADRPVQIFPDGSGRYTGLQGIHAMTVPGLYTLVISGTFPAGESSNAVPFAFSQAVLIGAGNYPFDPVLIVSPETIDPAVTMPEDAQWAALTAPVTTEKLWDGQFQSPAPSPYQDCWPSLFGNRRSYNGSPYQYFHTGLDFCGGVGTEILAPAGGEVVFAGPLTVRGNATVINHGWGVYSGYLHQSEILVNVGDRVTPGQIIGKVGGTGRVTGPHLHWEIWVGGVQVDPMDWLKQVFPLDITQDS